jgi:hypothetical protein
VAVKGYAQAHQVEAWYGADLATAQLAQVDAWLETAEQAIDAATGQPFGIGAVTDERVYPDGPYVYLRHAPIASVQAIHGLHRGSTTQTALTLTTQYELDDLATGRLYLPDWRAYAVYYVDYTPATAIPAAIQEATAALLADWLTQAAPGMPGADIKSYSVGQELTVTRFDPATAAGLPPRVEALLAPYRTGTVFA